LQTCAAGALEVAKGSKTIWLKPKIKTINRIAMKTRQIAWTGAESISRGGDGRKLAMIYGIKTPTIDKNRSSPP
jgi:hypothetical protein